MPVLATNISRSSELDEIERIHQLARRAISIPDNVFVHVQEAQRRFIEGVAESFAHLTRITERLGSQIAEAHAPIVRWHEQMVEIIAPVARWGEELGEVLAPFIEEQRVAEVILHLGLLPHAEIIRLLANAENPPEGSVTEMAERIALDLWPKIRRALDLSLTDCLNDQKIFRSFEELVRAHDSGLYQSTTPAAASVIERAARLAQRHGQRINKPRQWLDAEVCELSCTHVRSWRVLSVLTEQTFAPCWTDVQADTMQYPNRHAAAHGFGGKISNGVDSLNAVLAAHFVITAASAFEKHAVH